MVIDSILISKLIKKENSLVQLALISLAKKLEILNGIRSIDHYNKLKKRISRINKFNYRSKIGGIYFLQETKILNS